MDHPINRRNFVRTVTGVAAGTVAAMSLGQQTAAAEPISRNDVHRFKFSLAAYSYRRLLQAKDASLTLRDFIDDCAKLGLEGTELTSYYFPPQPTPEYLRSLKRQCFRLGLDISGTAVGNDFGHPEGEARKKQIEHVKNWIRHAEVLGAPVIRIFAGHQQKKIDAKTSHRLMVEGMQECCDFAGQHGVHLALENHGGPTATAEGLLSLVRDVKSDWFGVNLDTGNFHTEDIYGDLEKVAPYAINVQVKVVISGPDRQKHPTDFERLAKILQAAAYRGYIVLEYEEAGDPRQECQHYLDQLREAFA